jgi:hypothetical protein
MKKTLIFSTLFLLSTLAAVAQKTEVLYFKAELGCCMARACDALQNDIKTVIEKHYDAKSVVFKEVRLNNPANKQLIEKYKAKSQTVIIVKNGDTESFKDLSPVARKHLRLGNIEELETDLIAELTESLK